MGAQTQDMYERYVKSGVSTRMMVERESDFDRIMAGLGSDLNRCHRCHGGKLYAGDLREDIAKIKVPTLVFGSWDRIQGVYQPRAHRGQSA